MAYNTILAYLANATQAPAAIAAAAAIARRGGAHLTGLYVVPAMRLYVASPYGGVDVTSQLMEQHRAWHDAEAVKVKAIFDQNMAGETFGSAWHRADTLHVDPLTTIMEFGRTCELVVAAQDGATEEDLADERIAERLMMEAGRPVLLVPGHKTVTGIGRDVTVGWDGSREAARAVFDALPLLRDAEIVHLVCVDPRVEAGESASRAGDVIATALARCGVTCEAVEAASRNQSIGEELLARAADYGSDLIVMGGYGQSRFRQLVFGGVTRHVLADMPMPVLMSH